jgi:hypothetical protein
MMGLSIGVHLLTGCALTGVVQVFVIQYTIKGAGAFDIFFVNSLDLPFFSGFTTFFVLLAITPRGYHQRYLSKKSGL